MSKSEVEPLIKPPLLFILLFGGIAVAGFGAWNYSAGRFNIGAMEIFIGSILAATCSIQTKKGERQSRRVEGCGNNE